MRTGSDRTESRHDPRLRRRRRACAGDRAHARQLPGRGACGPQKRTATPPCSSASARPRSKNVTQAACAAISPRRRSSRNASWSSSASAADALIELGAELSAAHFVAGPVRRRDRHLIGKGFAGVMKRHNFAWPARKPRRLDLPSQPRLDRTPAGSRAGSSRARRWPAISATSGSRRRTSKVVATDAERGLILVQGSVPGAGAVMSASKTRSSGHCPRRRRFRPASRVLRRPMAKDKQTHEVPDHHLR